MEFGSYIPDRYTYTFNKQTTYIGACIEKLFYFQCLGTTMVYVIKSPKKNFDFIHIKVSQWCVK